MKVVLTERVRNVMRTLGHEDLQRVQAWLDHLANWETDEFVRNHSVTLNVDERIVYMFRTSTDLRIFFTIDKDILTVIDIAKKETILSSGSVAVAGP
jgi:hypothetical protein